MNRRFFLHTAFLAVSLLSPALLHAQQAQLTAEEILQAVRHSYAMQDSTMTGVLRDAESGRKEPLELMMGEQIIRFRFSNPPADTIQLDLTTTPASLWQIKTGGNSRVPLKDAAKPVRDGMDLNYEDLSLRFLYWKKAELLGEERVSTVKCWKLRVTAPDRSGPYGVVDLWIHKDSGGIAKMEAWDVLSRAIVKRFQVTKVQDVGKAKVLKEMRIEAFNAEDKSRSGITYMTMNKPVQQ